MTDRLHGIWRDWRGFVLFIAVMLVTAILGAACPAGEPEAFRVIHAQPDQDEFAGRVATKVMQTALGVRDSVMKLTDVLVYVCVYFIGGLLLVAKLLVNQAKAVVRPVQAGLFGQWCVFEIAR